MMIKLVHVKINSALFILNHAMLRIIRYTIAIISLTKLCPIINYSHIMSPIASDITGVSSVCSTVCSGTDQRKQQRSASLAFVRGIPGSPVDSPHKGPVTRKCFHLMTSSRQIHLFIVALCSYIAPNILVSNGSDNDLLPVRHQATTYDKNA